MVQLGFYFSHRGVREIILAYPKFERVQSGSLIQSRDMLSCQASNFS